VLLLFWLSATLQLGLPGVASMLQLALLLRLMLVLLLLPVRSCRAACSSNVLGLRQGSAAFAVMTLALYRVSQEPASLWADRCSFVGLPKLLANRPSQIGSLVWQETSRVVWEMGSRAAAVAGLHQAP
jgi:hypothetical protein